MAGLVVQDEGVKLRLEAMRTAWNSTALKLRLFSNTPTITKSSVLGDFTECTFAGYAAQNIVTWAAATIAAHLGNIAAAANVFTRSTTGTAQAVKGYFVTDSGNTKLYWAELAADTTITVTNAGDTVTVTAAIDDKSTLG